MEEAIKHERSETKNLEYLLGLQKDPSQRQQLLILFDEYGDDRIAEFCNERGECVYEGPEDPNALINRVRFWSPGESIGTFFENINLQPILDRRHFWPSVDRVNLTRQLFQLDMEAAQSMEIPKLETHEDYLTYFELFHPRMLEELFRRTVAFDLMDGCNGPCRKTCSAEVRGPVKHSLPFKTWQWILQNFTHLMSDPAVYYASDLQFYKDGQRTGLDVLKEYQRYFGQYPSMSLVFSLSDNLASFLWRLLKNGVPFSRLSRLVTGEDPQSVNILIGKIKQKAQKEGESFDGAMEGKIRAAFATGDKAHVPNTIAGMSVDSTTREEDILNTQITCENGVIFRAGEGFFATMATANSRVFPFGSQNWRIAPQTETIVLPQVMSIDEHRIPFTPANFLPKPRFSVFSRDGAMLSNDTTPTEKGVGNYEEQVVWTALTLSNLVQRTPLPSDGEEEREAVKPLKGLFEKVMVAVSKFSRKRAKLCKKFKNNPEILLEIKWLDKYLEALMELPFLIKQRAGDICKTEGTWIKEPEIVKDIARQIERAEAILREKKDCIDSTRKAIKTEIELAQGRDIEIDDPKINLGDYCPFFQAL